MDKKKVWLDTNILIDFLTQRDSFGEDASKIFTLAEERKIDLYMSILSFVNTYYILKGKHYKVPPKDIKLAFEQLLQYIQTSEHQTQNLEQALQSDFEDFEDAIQYFSSQNITGIDVIVTRNKDDFANAETEVLSPKEFLESLS